jgi:hypothetical protein
MLFYTTLQALSIDIKKSTGHRLSGRNISCQSLVAKKNGPLPILFSTDITSTTQVKLIGIKINHGHRSFFKV